MILHHPFGHHGSAAGANAGCVGAETDIVISSARLLPRRR
jgi:hypothetical protein